MREIERIVEDITEIYRKSGTEAEEYLHKARKLKEVFGPGPAIVYCWFYSVPQKWAQVEPKIFELMKHTYSFDLNFILSMSTSRIASILKPMIFYNEISLQLKNFCSAIKSEYSSWNHFANALRQESLFSLFEKLRNYRNIRITLKNLAAMKILVGMEDDLLIFDIHVARLMGIDKKKRSRYVIQMGLFESLIDFSREITNKLRDKGLEETIMAQWSLAIWFEKAKISANDILKSVIF